jgi:hypothetical protein
VAEPKPYAPGQTFTINEPGSPHHHLYIVMAVLSGKVIAVPLNTVTMYTDQTLILSPQDHPAFIKHETSVSYDYVRDFEESLLHKLEKMKATTFARREECSAELLTRVQELAFKSDLIKPKYENMLAEALGKHEL